MSGRHAICAVCTLILAIVVPSVAISPLSTQANAVEPGLLHASLTKPGPVLVGERVAITVKLLAVTMFASAPTFEVPTIPGALLLKVEDRPVLSTENIDGEIYAAQQHELALFVMRPERAQVPPFSVRFESPLHFGENPSSIG